MARSKAAKRKPTPDGKGTDLNAPDLNASDGRGGHARAQARKAAVKKAFGLAPGTREGSASLEAAYLATSRPFLKPSSIAATTAATAKAGRILHGTRSTLFAKN